MSVKKIAAGFIGAKPISWTPQTEADHFVRCDCGAWVDYRDPEQVLDHSNGAPHPHPSQTRH